MNLQSFAIMAVPALVALRGGFLVAIWAADPFIGREQALQVALDAETAGREFYSEVLRTTDGPEIRVLAKEFVEEETQHVAELQRWMQLHLSGHALPTES